MQRVMEAMKVLKLRKSISHTTSTGVQTDLTRNHILFFQQELIEANERINKLEGLLKGTAHIFTAEATLSNDRFVQFYTGLPHAAILNAVYCPFPSFCLLLCGKTDLCMHIIQI